MFKKLCGKMAAAFILALALSLIAVPGAFALNYSVWGDETDNTPLSFTGYRYSGQGDRFLVPTSPSIE